MTNSSTAESIRWSSRLTAILLASVFLWGTGIAIGAYLWDKNPSKGFIVFGCTVGFLTLWGVVLAFSRYGNQVARIPKVENPLNRMSVISFGLSAASALIMVVAISGSFAGLFSEQRGILFITFLATLVSGVLALVGLSDRDRARLRSLGLVSLLLCVLTLVGGFYVPTI